jgi:malic enzyme
VGLCVGQVVKVPIAVNILEEVQVYSEAQPVEGLGDALAVGGVPISGSLGALYFSYSYIETKGVRLVNETDDVVAK